MREKGSTERQKLGMRARLEEAGLRVVAAR